MKQRKNNAVRLVSWGLAAVALVLGVMNIVFAQTAAYDEYAKHCKNESFSEGEVAICEDMATQFGALTTEIQKTEAIVLFSTCAILVLFGMSRSTK